VKGGENVCTASAKVRAKASKQQSAIVLGELAERIKTHEGSTNLLIGMLVAGAKSVHRQAIDRLQQKSDVDPVVLNDVGLLELLIESCREVQSGERMRQSEQQP